MRSRPTREDLLDLLTRFTAGELAIEHFMLEFDELSKLGVSATLRDREATLFGEFWRYYVDAYTPHYKKPQGIRGRLKLLAQQFKGEPEVGADEVQSKAAELRQVMLSP